MKQQNLIHVDASQYTFGRLVSHVAKLLIGKHSAQFATHIPQTNVVTIKNISQVRITGKKISQTPSYTHTGYPGKLRKEMKYMQFSRKPQSVFLKSLAHMLPKNTMRKLYLKQVTFE